MNDHTRATYPLYVFVPDELDFRRVDSEPLLQWFEQIDVVDMEHHAWDALANRFFLVPDGKQVGLRFVSARDVEGLGMYVDEYIEQAERRGFDPELPGSPLVPLSELQSLLERGRSA